MKIIRFLHPRDHLKIIGLVLNNSQKNNCICFNKVMTMKIRLKMKNKSHRYDIIRPRPRYGHKYTKYKMCLSIMMVLCIKQKLSNIWSSNHEKVKKLSNTVTELKKACHLLWELLKFLIEIDANCSDTFILVWLVILKEAKLML